MLTERIKAPTRCTSAEPLGVAIVTGYKVVLSKESKDDSGKATLLKTCNESDVVYGVLFEVGENSDEMKKLDKAEGTGSGGYIAKEDFTVIFDGKPLNNVRTYIAPLEKCKSGLPVYDWYLALMIAGAKQHELEDTYISGIIEANKVTVDSDDERDSKIEALQILKETGFENVFSELNYLKHEKGH